MTFSLPAVSRDPLEIVSRITNVDTRCVAPEASRHARVRPQQRRVLLLLNSAGRHRRLALRRSPEQSGGGTTPDILAQISYDRKGRSVFARRWKRRIR